METRLAQSRTLVLIALAGLLAGARATGAQDPPQLPPGVAVIEVDEDELTGVPALAVDGLTCEHHAEPLVLETTVPRFLWRLVLLDPERRKVRQVAYRILVASSPAELAAGRGDLWNSATVGSPETLDIPYGWARRYRV